MSTTSPILVYHHLAAGHPVVKHSLAIVTKSELEALLSTHPDLQQTTKTIPRGATVVEIHPRDLLAASQGAEGAPNLEANVAAVRLPVRVVLGRAVAGWWGEMVVLSKRVGGAGA